MRSVLFVALVRYLWTNLEVYDAAPPPPPPLVRVLHNTNLILLVARKLVTKCLRPILICAGPDLRHVHERRHGE